MPQLADFLIHDEDPEEKDKILYHEVPVGFPIATELDLIRQFAETYPPLPQMGSLSIRVSDVSSDTPNAVLSRKGDAQAGSISVMLVMNISKQEEPQHSERVKLYTKAAGIVQPLASFQQDSSDFAILYKVGSDELLETKKEALRGFLLLHPRPEDTKRLGALHSETGPSGITMDRLLPDGKVKLVIEYSKVTPVDGQKERYVLEKLFEELNPS